jgi:hypothetical protein
MAGSGRSRLRAPAAFVAVALTVVACWDGPSDPATFCDEVVPLLDGREPRAHHMDTIIEASEDYLSEGDAQMVIAQAEAVREQRVRLLEGAPGSITTGPLVDVVKEICDDPIFGVTINTD